MIYVSIFKYLVARKIHRLALIYKNLGGEGGKKRGGGIEYWEWLKYKHKKNCEFCSNTYLPQRSSSWQASKKQNSTHFVLKHICKFVSRLLLFKCSFFGWNFTIGFSWWLKKNKKRLMNWLSTERSNCHFSCATFASKKLEEILR